MELHSMALVMSRFFERPRCRPWDLVKGRRYRCCHTLTSEGHGRGCMTGVTVHISKYEELP